MALTGSGRKDDKAIVSGKWHYGFRICLGGLTKQRRSKALGLPGHCCSPAASTPTFHTGTPLLVACMSSQ